MATKMTRKQQSMAYFANCIVADGVNKGKTLAAIRWELRYVVEHSEVLGVSDIETMIEIGTGKRVA